MYSLLPLTPGTVPSICLLSCVSVLVWAVQAWSQPVPEVRRWLHQPWPQLERELQTRLENLPDHQARILFLRDVVFQLGLWPGSESDTRLPSVQQVLGDDLFRIPTGRLVYLLTQDSMSTLCGDMAQTLAQLCSRFGYPACAIGMGKQNGTSGHMATLVEYLDSNSQQRFYTYHDPSYGYSYADSSGQLLSLDSIIVYIERKQTDRLVELFPKDELHTRVILNRFEAFGLEFKDVQTLQVKPTRNKKLAQYALITRADHHRLSTKQLFKEFARYASLNGFEHTPKAAVAINLYLWGAVNHEIIDFNTWRYVQNVAPLYHQIPEAQRFKPRLE